MTTKNNQGVREEIRRILIPADYHTEDHQNIPVDNWSYTREGIDFIVAELSQLILSKQVEVLAGVKEFYVGTVSYGTPDYLIGREEFIQQMTKYIDTKLDELKKDLEH